jgi:hypothetical protein
VPRIADGLDARGRWLLPVAALSLVLLAGAAAFAQRVVPEAPPTSPAPLPPTGGGTGGGAGLIPTLPGLGASPSVAPPPAPAPVAPQVAPAAPQAAPPVAVPGTPPGVPAPIIRFRCEVAPGQSTCKEQPPSDGGGGDECDCARDLCYSDGAGARICEKP